MIRLVPYWQALGIFILGGLCLPFLFPIPLGKIILTSPTLSTEQIANQVNNTPTQQDKIWQISFDSALLHEKHMSIAEVLARIMPILSLNESTGELSSDRFILPIIKKAYASLEQLAFFPLNDTTLLRDVARIAPFSETEFPAQWYDASVAQWYPAVVVPQTTYLSVLPFSTWQSEYQMQKKLQGTDIQIHWHDKNTTWLLWWQIIALLVSGFLGIGEYMARRNPDTTVKSEGFSVRGVYIAPAKIPKKIPSWKDQIISRISQIHTAPKYIVRSVIIMLSLALFLLDFPRFEYQNTFYLQNENQTKDEKTFTDAKALLIQWTEKGGSFSSAIFEPLPKSRAKILIEIPEKGIAITPENLRPQTFGTKIFFPSLGDAMTITNNENEAEQVIKTLSTQWGVEKVNWTSSVQQTTELIPNYSALKENGISALEITTFLDFIGTGKHIGEVFLTAEKNEMGTDLSGWFLKNTKGELVSANNVILKTMSSNPKTPQTIYFSFSNIFAILPLFISSLDFQLVYLKNLIILLIIVLVEMGILMFIIAKVVYSRVSRK